MKITALLKAIRDYGDLRVKIAQAGMPPHTDFWHQALDEAEQKIVNAMEPPSEGHASSLSQGEQPCS